MKNIIAHKYTKSQTKLQVASSPKFIFFPYQLLHFYWELLLLVIALYLGVSEPYIMAFSYKNEHPEIFNYTVTALYILDIFVNLNTACYVKGHIVTERRTIIKEYLKFWFWIDCLSATPIDMIINFSGQELTFLKAFRLVKILRIFKLIKLVKLSKLKFTFSKLEDRVTNKSLLSILSIIKLQIYIFLVAHIIGCSMFSLNADAFEPDSFTNLILNKCNDPLSTAEMYLTAVYWSYTTMISLGYGDIHPVSTSERAFGIICMSISSVTFGVVLGYISTIITKNSEFETYRHNVILSANEYLKVNKVEKTLGKKVKMYLNYMFQENKEQEIDLFDLFEILSEPLCEQIFLYLNGTELENCKIFENFPLVFRRKLSRLMHSKTYAPHDDILIESFEPEGIFFIQNGLIEIFDWKSKACIKSLTERNYFGEIGLFTRRPICASVRCIHYAEVIFLACVDFDSILETVPAANEIFKEIQKACSGSLNVLGVICYLCKEPGHVARMCTSIEKIREKNKEQWLDMKNESKKVDVNRIKRYIRKRKVNSKGSRVFRGVKGKRRENYLRADSKLADVIDRVHFKKDSIKLQVFERSRNEMRSTVLSNILEDSGEDDTFNLDITELDLN